MYICIYAYLSIYIYTYKTTLRVIRRLWGVGGSTCRSIGPHIDLIELTSSSHRICIGFTPSSQRHKLSHQYHMCITSLSHRYHNGITSISHRYHSGITPVSHRHHIGIASISHWYHIGITQVSHRYHFGITTVSHRLSHRYHIGITSVSLL